MSSDQRWFLLSVNWLPHIQLSVFSREPPAFRNRKGHARRASLTGASKPKAFTGVSHIMTAQPSPQQIRGGRAMLGWSLIDLSQGARVSVVTIKRVEDGELTVSPALLMIQDALEAAGIQFLPDDGSGPGVRMKTR